MTRDWDEAEVRELRDELVSLHGEVKSRTGHGSEDVDPGEGVRQLLTTILSQNVADENTRRAAESLFEEYEDFAAIEEADHDELADVIRVAGLPDQKAARIQRALAAVHEESGAYSIAFP